jgi:hypothetical protein
MERNPMSRESDNTKEEHVEISPEQLAELRDEVTRRLKYGKSEREFEFQLANLRSYLPEEPSSRRFTEQTARLEIMENIYREYLEAKRKFWMKIKMASSALILAFSATQDTKVPQIDFGNGSFAERHEAEEELKQNGIPRYQRRAHINGLSEALADGFFPYSYSVKNAISVPIDIARIIGALTFGQIISSNEEKIRWHKDIASNASNERSRVGIEDGVRRFENRVDAWRIYLGLPQKHETFGISEFRPAKSKEDRYYYKINKFNKLFENQIVDETTVQSPVAEMIRYVKESAKPGTDRVIALDRGLGIMGQYTIALGQDEKGQYISYWDRWDLEGSVEGRDGVIGKPFEIYDRVYYDPKTYEIIHTSSNDLKN